MNKIKLIYLINDTEVERKFFYQYLERCVTNLFYCCSYEIKSEYKELRRIKREILYGFIKYINGIKFQIKRGD